MQTNGAQACNSPYTYPNSYPSYYPPSMPSHITHSWGFAGLGGADPLDKLAAAMNRLAAAIERHNEISDHQKDGVPEKGG